MQLNENDKQSIFSITDEMRFILDDIDMDADTKNPTKEIQKDIKCLMKEIDDMVKIIERGCLE